MKRNNHPAPKKETKIRSFDGTEETTSFICRPDRYDALFSTIDGESSVSMQGAGLSLPLASATSGSLTIKTKAFNRILSFVPQKNIITVEAGIRLGDLLNFLIKTKYWLSPLPGHPNISVGGCVAFNVHGKGQGYFSDSVLGCTLYHPRHGEMFLSRSKEKDIFNLTVGGMGSTGFITSVTLKLTPLKGVGIRKLRLPAANLVQAAESMLKLKKSYDQVYSWNNLTRSSVTSFGQGYIYCEDFSNAPMRSSLPEFKKLSAANRGHNIAKVGRIFMGRKINLAYDIFEKLKPKVELLDLFEGAFPISGKEIYFHLFGGRGYREYQMSIPLEHWRDFAFDLHQLCQKQRPDITLGSLKIFDKSFENYLNFCRRGVILAINALANKKTLKFFSELDHLVIKYGGIPNICKDSRLDRATVIATYKEHYRAFVQDLNDYDNRNIFTNGILKRIIQ